MKPAIYSFRFAILFVACGNQSLPDKNLSALSAIINKTGSDTTINFENNEIGKTPSGFTASYTGSPQRLGWKIVDDNANKAIAQLKKIAVIITTYSYWIISAIIISKYRFVSRLLPEMKTREAVLYGD